MSREYINLRATTDREKLLARAHEVFPGMETKDSQVIDAALRHLVESNENLKGFRDLDLTPAQADVISTPVLSANYYPQVKRNPTPGD